MPFSDAYRPAPRWLDLGNDLADPVAPATFPSHVLRFRNDRAAARVGLERLTPEEWESHFAQFAPLPENLAAPLALRYHGHQFGSYNPDLGDGRGFLFAQLKEREGAGRKARLLDLGTKGSGRTPWSRSGDGRLTLKGGVREALATEQLEALGVVTSKTFSLFETGEELLRGDEPSPTRSSVMVRLSHSHVRFGMFQRLAYLREHDEMRRLLAYSVKHYFPELADEPNATLPHAFLLAVTARAAPLAASYMVAGFVHGVLNTDNMNITGESFDYGPWRFLPQCDPSFTAAYFDHSGFYAYGRQPGAILWNLGRLRDALRLLEVASSPFPEGAMEKAYEAAFSAGLQQGTTARLGVVSRGPLLDEALADTCFGFLADSSVGFAQLFFDWYGGVARPTRAFDGVAKAQYRGEAFDAFAQCLEGYAPARADALDDPYFARKTPCDMLIEEVEAIWAPIDQRDDWSLFEAKIEEIRAFGRAVREPATY